MYEGIELGPEGRVGLITYMRTDSTRLSEDAVREVRELIYTQYGKEYLPHEARLFKKGKGSQDAHEAIRPTSMTHIMDRFGLWPFFDMVVTALDVKHPKPHPESIEKILQNFNLNKREVVFIGDSEVDQQTARSSGVPFIAYKNGALEADFHIDDHLEVLNFLRTFN